jgi:hypothetical protein
MRSILTLFVLCAAVLAGCASPPTTPGKYLVYRDASGSVTRQFDYPTEALCARVEAAAGREARCQPQPAGAMAAQATLRYSPPGVVVHAHYPDLARCRSETGQLATGVELINACTSR